MIRGYDSGRSHLLPYEATQHTKKGQTHICKEKNKNHEFSMETPRTSLSKVSIGFDQNIAALNPGFRARSREALLRVLGLGLGPPVAHFSDPREKEGNWNQLFFGAWTILVGPPKKRLEKELEPLNN